MLLLKDDKKKDLISLEKNPRFSIRFSDLRMSSAATSTPIVIKHGSTTYHMQLANAADQNKVEQFRSIADYIRIPSDRLKLIYKGKKYSETNWNELTLVPQMTFLSVGEQHEDETDINSKDIECIMHQMNVDRNTAVRALKLHSDVIDAILYLGNKWRKIDHRHSSSSRW